MRLYWQSHLDLDGVDWGGLRNDGDVFIWSWNLDDDGGLKPEWLGTEERQRAARFAFPELRRRFVAAHCGLRQVLGRCTGRPPASLAFAVNAWGKPQLQHGHGDTDLRFNLSHSGAKALLAVTLGRDIGVDIEEVRKVDSAIAPHFFAVEEVASLATSNNPQAFHRIWTCKEAVVKAVGLGLSMPLDSFAVSLEGSARLLRIDEVYGAPGSWDLAAFEMAGGYLGAVALAPRGSGRS